MRTVTSSITTFTLSVFVTGNAAAASVCTNADGLKQIAQLSYLEMSDAMTTSPSVAGPQRQAIIRELARRYCRTIDQLPRADRQEAIARTNCTMYSGIIDNQMVYWVNCPTCEEQSFCE